MEGVRGRSVLRFQDVLTAYLPLIGPVITEDWRTRWPGVPTAYAVR